MFVLIKAFDYLIDLYPEPVKQAKHVAPAAFAKLVKQVAPVKQIKIKIIMEEAAKGEYSKLQEF